VQIGQLVDGFIPFALGIYLLLLVHQRLPEKPEHQVRMEQWRQKFGGMMKVVAPFLIAFGVLQMARAFF